MIGNTLKTRKTETITASGLKRQETAIFWMIFSQMI